MIEQYQFGFNGHEKVNEIAEIGNHTTAEHWEYDTRLFRRWNLDPVDQVSISNYAAFRNSPIIFVDPDGARVFHSYYTYKGHAEKNGLKVLNQKDIWKQGHWLKNDVQYKFFDFWKPTFNEKYAKAKGSEVRWMGAAEKTVSTLNWALSPGADLLGKSNREINDFINAGNKAILDDMMPRINSVLSGTPLKGNNAIKWDA